MDNKILSDFKYYDSIYKMSCLKIEVDKAGNELRVLLLGHIDREEDIKLISKNGQYWQRLQPGETFKTFDRPKLKGKKESLYYSELLSEESKAGATPERINFIIGLYEMSLKHKKKDKLRKYGFFKDELRKFKKIWNH